jgi:hypothetical protein
MNEKEILALEDKRFGAMIARDFKALEAMLHGDLLYSGHKLGRNPAAQQSPAVLRCATFGQNHRRPSWRS